jgi:hypothetical protein
MGGAQGATAGFYQDQTAARWINVGVNDGATLLVGRPERRARRGRVHRLVLRLELRGPRQRRRHGPRAVDVRLALGRARAVAHLPQRQQGRFEEFNPSHYQLTGTQMAAGAPGLWCEGVQQQNTTDSTGQFCDITEIAVSLDLGDLDGDLDIDILHGQKYEAPRVFQNRWAENGGTLASATSATR